MSEKREFKFRAWGDGSLTYSRQYYKSDLPNENLSTFFRDNFGCEIQQYTGYNDINDVEIYEGDIISSPNGQIKKALIYFSQATFWYKEWCDFSNDWHHSEMGWCEQYGSKELGILHWSANRIALEVIGNVFDNPELLEGVHS